MRQSGPCKLRRGLALRLSLFLLPAVFAAEVSAQVSWRLAVYYDSAYPTAWTGGTQVRDTLSAAGYEVLNAAQLKSWMDARIADGLLSVVVFGQDIVPDTVAESKSSDTTIRRYLNKGGKIVWYGDIPMYYQGHSDGTRTTWDTSGSSSILGFNAAGGAWDVNQPVTITTDGAVWGLQQTWASVRPAISTGLRVLARDANNNAAAWVRHYGGKDTFRGFVRFHDRSGTPDLGDLRALAEYAPATLLGDSLMDSILATFFYPWYGNPGVTGTWVHWDDANYQPPLTWTANYLPSYPDATWNPAVQLYDSNDPEVIRWQDRWMARAGIDIASASWWGINTHEDRAFAKAIRIAKSVQWCIYYELDSIGGEGQPTPQKIYDDLHYVLERYGPTRNYAKIDGKWLVTVYAVSGTEAADRWRQAKAMLAASGYPVYLNGDVADPSAATAPDPWDSIHRYNPVAYQTLTTMGGTVDDSASVAPGFWRIGDQPALVRSLPQFTSACQSTAANHERSRFVFVETWSEWHEGTQIEPGQEIIPDTENGFSPAGYDYGQDFIDAVAASPSKLAWQSAGHRPLAPARLEAEHMVWEEGTASEPPSAWRLPTAGPRIGSAIEVAQSQSNVWLVIRARGVQVASPADWPLMNLYLDNTQIAQWTVNSASDWNYRAVLPMDAGIHAIEVSMSTGPGATGDVDLVVDFTDVYFASPGGDYDGDGAADEIDNCPMTANSSQQDSDGDGVGDSCDACPNTNPGIPVDSDGCPPETTGDLDRDGDVDQTDFGRFQSCLGGSGSMVPAGCGPADLDSDGDVDQSDFGVFFSCLGGAGNPSPCTQEAANLRPPQEQVQP